MSRYVPRCPAPVSPSKRDGTGLSCPVPQGAAPKWFCNCPEAGVKKVAMDARRIPRAMSGVGAPPKVGGRAAIG
jgi:hypothetical protein